MIECGVNCVTNDLCKFLNYDNSNQSCYLLQTEYYYIDPNNLAEKTGWTFWTPEYQAIWTQAIWGKRIQGV